MNVIAKFITTILSICGVLFVGLGVAVAIPTSRQFLVDEVSKYATPEATTEDNTTNELNNQLDEMQDLLNEYLTTNMSLNSRINNLNSQLDYTDEQIQSLTDEIAELRLQKQALESDLNASEEEKANIQSQLDAKTTEYDTLFAQKNALQTQLTDAQSRITELNNTITSCNATIAQLRSDLQTKNTQNSNLQSQINNLQTQISNQANTITGLNATITELEAQIQTLSNVQTFTITINNAGHNIDSIIISDTRLNTTYQLKTSTNSIKLESTQSATITYAEADIYATINGVKQANNIAVVNNSFGSNITVGCYVETKTYTINAFGARYEDGSISNFPNYVTKTKESNQYTNNESWEFSASYDDGLSFLGWYKFTGYDTNWKKQFDFYTNQKTIQGNASCDLELYAIYDYTGVELNRDFWYKGDVGSGAPGELSVDVSVDDSFVEYIQTVYNTSNYSINCELYYCVKDDKTLIYSNTGSHVVFSGLNNHTTGYSPAFMLTITITPAETNDKYCLSNALWIEKADYVSYAEWAGFTLSANSNMSAIKAIRTGGVS